MDLKNCTLCPRNCHADRTKSQGFCHAGNDVEVALVSLHQWEEPCLSGTKGAGTVFFSHCSMQCIFCQNYEISTKGRGFKISVKRLAEIFLEQQKRNAHCLELVTATHYVPQIIEALDTAKKNGLNIPIVYNSSGYEKIETLEALRNYIDVFLPDFKYFSGEIAKKYSNAADYPEVAQKAIAKMYELVGKPVFKDNLMQKGVIIRHLILPWHYKESLKIVKYIWETYHDNVYLSLMNQYTPMYKALTHPELKRRLTTFEYDKVVNFADSLGFTNCYIQQGKTATKDFVPKFNGENVKKPK